MDKENQQKCDIFFHIRRFDPERDENPHWEQYTIKVEPGVTILDGLHQIKQNQDSTLSWRFSCRMGVCGSCAMLVSGKPMLACNTQILDITDHALTLAPLPNFDIIRDLVPDLTRLFKDHVAIQPYIQGQDPEEIGNPTGEFFQTPHELEKYLQFSYCIKCGCCMAACPTMATDRKYLGPVALAQAYRYNTDSRDRGYEGRKSVVAAGHGAFNCHYAGECSNVCPKGVDPARAIQLMKRDLVLDCLKLKRRKKPCRVMGLPSGVKRKPPIPFPPYTVEQK